MIYPFFYQKYKDIISKYSNIDMSKEVPKKLKVDLWENFGKYAIENNLVRTDFYYNIILDIIETYQRQEVLKEINNILKN